MENNESFKFLQGGGEMGKLIRAVNWSDTPIGPVAAWPTSLKIAVGIMLSSPFPMYIAWGKEYTQLYNDGYRPILGATKHPKALGIGTAETFSEIWHIIGSMFDGVMKGTAVGFPNFMLPLDRNGYVEECFFDFSYSPIMNETGEIGGVLVTVIEVTERIKADKALKEAKEQLELANAESERQRERLKAFFMQAPAGICILDGPDLIFELINPSYQQLFPERELLGKPVLEALPEITNQEISVILQDVYRNDKTFEGLELKIPLARHENGIIEDRFFNFIYQPRHDVHGKVDGILVFVFEVTDIVSSKILLEESEKRFRTMVEQSPVPMLVTKGESMVFEEINRPMLELIGRDDFVKGLSAYEAMPELKGQPIMDQLYRTFQTGEIWTGYEQLIFINRNGKPDPGYFNVSYKPLYENGKITGVLQSAVDVTEQVRARKDLEKAEDTLKLALKAAQLGTFDMDMEKGTMEWDERCRTLFGISHHDTVTYEKDFLNGLHPDDRERVQKVIENVFKKSISNGHYDIEYRTVDATDKRVRWIRAMGKTYFDTQDNPLRFIGSVLDITEIKADELRKNDFIGMVSHELKTPLTSLQGYVQLLQVKVKTDKDNFIVDMLERVNSQVKKMNNLINGFLNLSRFESGKIHLNKQNFELPGLVKEIMEEMGLIFSKTPISLGTCAPIAVYADRDKIGSVITNLISNAVKYSPSGSPIEIKCESTEDFALISVKDKGIGIKQQDIDKLFERYFRVEKGNNTIAGFGIGLYLSAEIMQRHNGKISVESQPGEGSTFYISIPLQ